MGSTGSPHWAETHTVVYAPCHRSHIDYLLLSYVLFHRGFMVPHVAAGDNLDLPVVGGVLRRGGAFFMRRRFSGDRLYSAVFAEYIYQVFRRGHAVEYFVEGGRTRTGRLLPARTGVLQMTIDAHRRGVPRPIVFVPVYVGYDKLVEAVSYVDELRGAAKQSESVSGLFRNLRMVRQSFGSAQLCFGKPISLGGMLDDGMERPARILGERIGRGINACAYLNPTNLVALTTLSMPRQAIDESALVEQINLYRDLIHRDARHHDYRVTDMPAADIVRHVEKLGLLHRDTSTGSGKGTDGQVLSHDEFTAVLMDVVSKQRAARVGGPRIRCLPDGQPTHGNSPRGHQSVFRKRVSLRGARSADRRLRRRESLARPFASRRACRIAWQRLRRTA